MASTGYYDSKLFGVFFPWSENVGNKWCGKAPAIPGKLNGRNMTFKESQPCTSCNSWEAFTWKNNEV